MAKQKEIPEGIQDQAAPKRRQKAITAEEFQQRAAAMQTQGREGAHLPRINMAFTPDNYDFVKIVGAIHGMSMTRFTNWIVEQYWLEHMETYERAKALVADMSKE